MLHMVIHMYAPVGIISLALACIITHIISTDPKCFLRTMLDKLQEREHLHMLKS